MPSHSFSILLVSAVMWFSCSVALAEVDPLDPLAGDVAEAAPKQAKKETQKDHSRAREESRRGKRSESG